MIIEKAEGGEEEIKGKEGRRNEYRQTVKSRGGFREGVEESRRER